MPLYEYQCKKCRHKFEKIQKFSDRPIKKCPECGSPVEKVMHAPNVQFKGSGWYVTDYGGKGGDNAKSDGDPDKPEKKDKGKDKEAAKPDGAKGKEKEKDAKPKKSEAKAETRKSKD
ncbi:MAG TPA: zinc ribbon domain-containing protein [Candidatus Angelobacter sp.]|nr:zinc ribbon domain-containing protein [Candidatus Angelobacter sp.]